MLSRGCGLVVVAGTDLQYVGSPSGLALTMMASRVSGRCEPAQPGRHSRERRYVGIPARRPRRPAHNHSSSAARLRFCNLRRCFFSSRSSRRPARTRAVSSAGGMRRTRTSTAALHTGQPNAPPSGARDAAQTEHKRRATKTGRHVVLPVVTNWDTLLPCPNPSGSQWPRPVP